MFITEAFASASNTNPTSAVLSNLVPLMIFIVIFYLFLIKPQQKKIKEHEKMVKGLKSGDKIITGGGILAVVKKNKGKEIIVEISKGIEVKVSAETIKTIVK